MRNNPFDVPNYVSQIDWSQEPVKPTKLRFSKQPWSTGNEQQALSLQARTLKTALSRNLKSSLLLCLSWRSTTKTP
jgi:hypothetical protein